jgi:peptidyl-tRNA hydrolase, PTH1 family
MLVVGLGNPEKKYAKNRHNVGFMVLDSLASDLGAPEWRDKWKGRTTRLPKEAAGEVTLLEPMTFMNLSGESVQPAAAFLKASPSEILVVHDELDLPFGDVRLKVGGGHAGHNGLRSMIEHLGSPDFARVRVGIGRPPPGFRGDVADWVLSNFDGVEAAELPDVIDRSKAAIRRVLKDGMTAAMNATNARK